MPKLSELKLEKIRKVLQYTIEDIEKEIVIYNPIGKKRENLLKILQTGSQLTDKDKVADMLYKSILKELVEIDIDVKKTNSLMKAPSLTLMELNHEVSEIMNELQYEFVTSKLRELNEAKIKTLTTLSLKKAEELTNDLEMLKHANV